MSQENYKSTPVEKALLIASPIALAVLSGLSFYEAHLNATLQGNYGTLGWATMGGVAAVLDGVFLIHLFAGRKRKDSPSRRLQ